MKKLHAFTLIELLVVISIIAILAGLALPVFTSAMERGRATTDKNNLMSIGKGLMMYLNDNDDSMPSANPANGTTWPAMLQGKYVTDWNAFRSPFDKPSASRPSTSDAISGGGGMIPVSYGLNEKILDTFTAKWVNAASSVVLGAPDVDTSQASLSQVTFVASATSGVNVTIVNPGVQNCGTHQSRQAVNILFSDGHVQQMLWNTYIDGTSATGQQRWDPMYDPTAANQGG